jgi:hypothetical protein
MKKYKEKVLEIEAIQFDGQNHEKIIHLIKKYGIGLTPSYYPGRGNIPPMISWVANSVTYCLYPSDYLLLKNNKLETWLSPSFEKRWEPIP